MAALWAYTSLADSPSPNASVSVAALPEIRVFVSMALVAGHAVKKNAATIKSAVVFMVALREAAAPIFRNAACAARPAAVNTREKLRPVTDAALHEQQMPGMQRRMIPPRPGAAGRTDGQPANAGRRGISWKAPVRDSLGQHIPFQDRRPRERSAKRFLRAKIR
jgi:hypothetical protein